MNWMKVATIVLGVMAVSAGLMFAGLANDLDRLARIAGTVFFTCCGLLMAGCIVRLWQLSDE